MHESRFRKLTRQLEEEIIIKPITQNMNIIVTGAAGFIGSNLVKKIYKELPEAQVVGIDNMNDYYDVRLKENRLEELMQYPGFTNRLVKDDKIQIFTMATASVTSLMWMTL